MSITLEEFTYGEIPSGYGTVPFGASVVYGHSGMQFEAVGDAIKYIDEKATAK